MINTHKIILGDCIAGMKTMPDGCVQTCITSPPYFGLRDYGTGTWEGGEDTCDHKDDDALAERLRQKKSMISVGERTDGSTRTRVHDEQIGNTIQHRNICLKCGAHRTDAQIGQEETVEDYVQNMVKVFREVRRILRDDGTVWLNLGDSYMSQRGSAPPPQTIGGQRDMPTTVPGNRKAQLGLKHKDLIGIPWRVALALQADGWYLRQDIIWHKPNPMPESVADRCTKAHEYIFLLSKKSHYYFDHEAIKEPAKNWGTRDRTEMRGGTTDPKLKHHGLVGKEWEENPMKNKRSVWTVNTKGCKGAHFAVYPEKLIEPCVLAGCPIGGTVFDPFTGSGTTAVVALKNGRNYIGTELNPNYVKIAEDRIKEEVPQTLEGVFEQ